MEREDPKTVEWCRKRLEEKNMILREKRSADGEALYSVYCLEEDCASEYRFESRETLIEFCENLR